MISLEYGVVRDRFRHSRSGRTCRVWAPVGDRKTVENGRVRRIPPWLAKVRFYGKADLYLVIIMGLPGGGGSAGAGCS
jgi:hypothetical protein